MSHLHIFSSSNLIGNCCFNGSLYVEYIDNDNRKFTNFLDKNIKLLDPKIYCVYRTTPTIEECLKSTIRKTLINLDTLEPNINENNILLDCSPREDPRVFTHNDSLIVSYSHILNATTTDLQIRINANIYKNDNTVKHFIDFNLNEKCKTQKNWTFFQHIGYIHILYSIMPLNIYLWNTDIDFNNPTPEYLPIIKREWTHPIYKNLKLRGGTQPIIINNLFYVFTHSIDYEVYAIIIDPLILRVTKVSSSPLIPNRGNKKDIHFPCGVIYDETNDTFYISLGIDDIKLGLITITKNNLDKIMIDVIDQSLIENYNTIIDTSSKQFRHCWINSYGGCGNDYLIDYLRTNGLYYKTEIWDKLLCHSIDTFNNINIKRLYILNHPLLALASMYKCKSLETNLKKLSNNKECSFNYGTLLYFMIKQMISWSQIANNIMIVNRDDLKTKIFDIIKYVYNIKNDYIKQLSDLPDNDPYFSDNYDTILDDIKNEGKLSYFILQRSIDLFMSFFPEYNNNINLKLLKD